MKTMMQQETEAILEMAEKLSAMEIEIQRLKAIIAELEQLLRHK
jgi:hypothetical protein